MTINDAAVFLGIASPSVAETAQIQSIMDELSALITAYLGRDLDKKTHTETFSHPRREYIGLSHWPVTNLIGITEDGTQADLKKFDIHTESGILFKENHAGYFEKVYVVTYEAGYSPVPAEILAVFKTLLKDRYSSGGAIATGGTGNIKSVSLTGVASVTFDTSQGVSASSETIPADLLPYQAIFAPYMNRPMVW